MRNNKVIQALASVVLVGSVIAMAVTWRGGFAPGIESQPHQAAGWSMAKQTLSLLKLGGQVLVITRDTTEFKNPATDIVLASFKREMSRAKVRLGAVQALQTDALRPMEVPSGDFMNWIHNSPPGSVIVSFMGPPVLSAAERKRLGEIKSSIVAFCPGSWPDRINLRALFQQGLLHAAVVSRRNQPSAATTPHNLQASFDQNFMLITAANASDQFAVLEKPTP